MTVSRADDRQISEEDHHHTDSLKKANTLLVEFCDLHFGPRCFARFNLRIGHDETTRWAASPNPYLHVPSSP